MVVVWSYVLLCCLSGCFYVDVRLASFLVASVNISISTSLLSSSVQSFDVSRVCPLECRGGRNRD